MTETDSVSCDDDVLQEPQAVLAAALDAYVAMDEAGRVVGWNPSAEDTFGYRRGEACGRTVAELIIPERFRQAHDDGLSRLNAGGPGRVLGQRLRLEARHADGHEFPIEMTLTLTDSPAGRIYHAFCHDVTNAARISRYAAVEATVSRGLAEAAGSRAAAARVVEALSVKMGWPVAELWLDDEDRHVLRCAARHSTHDRPLGQFALDELELGTGLPGRVHQAGQARWICDLATDSASLRSRAAARVGLHVAVGVPVRAAGHVLGALCVYGDRIEDPEDSLTALLAGIAAQVGQYWERRRAEELAVELAHTKDEFLALVTHELRNPLAVITSTAALLEEELVGVLDSDQQNYLRAVSRSAQRLSDMTNDLLDLARLESGQLSVDPAPADLSEIIRTAVGAMRPAAAAKELTMVVDVPDRLEMYADGGRLQQVADNLLSNAVKYTPAGGTVTVTAAVVPADAGEQEHVSWTVADTGIGIPAEERSRLFRRFYRASTALDRRIPGTGLGLVITRTIVERHHGTIGLSDHEGPGTTFHITMPVKTPR